jgi:hypothetical protein
MGRPDRRHRNPVHKLDMPNYEYQVIYSKPVDPLFLPWSPQKWKDAAKEKGVEKALGMGLENQINKAADEGWELVSCSTASAGSLFSFTPMATAVLRRERRNATG